MTEAGIENLAQRAYRIALKELGVEERAGADHNPRILEYHQATSLKATSDEVPWCAAFVNWCLLKAGFRDHNGRCGTNSARARSFLRFGESVAVHEIQPGDIVIFAHPSNPAAGHVAFFHAWKNERTGMMSVCGGNQSNRVSIARYSIENLIGIRRATTNLLQA